MNVNNALKALTERTRTGSYCHADLIRQYLLDGQPSMVARFGSTEIKAVLFPKMPFPLRQFFENRIFGNMETLSGFFPSNYETIGRFAELMYEDMKQLDILGSWRIEERFLYPRFPNAKIIALASLEPYLSDRPWSAALLGKKVLVIHPFNKTIERQYKEKRHLLFADERILPEFASLQTVKAVQTIAGNKSQFNTWFDALESMKAEIDCKNYDIALLGCGAYGFPLAAHIKRSGRTAIHLGGATQILFGIKGRRWDQHPVISKLYNQHWVRPDCADTPTGAAKVENGCYW